MAKLTAGGAPVSGNAGRHIVEWTLSGLCTGYADRHVCPNSFLSSMSGSRRCVVCPMFRCCCPDTCGFAAESETLTWDKDVGSFSCALHLQVELERSLQQLRQHGSVVYRCRLRCRRHPLIAQAAHAAVRRRRQHAHGLCDVDRVLQEAFYSVAYGSDEWREARVALDLAEHPARKVHLGLVGLDLAGQKKARWFGPGGGKEGLFVVPSRTTLVLMGGWSHTKNAYGGGRPKQTNR